MAITYEVDHKIFSNMFSLRFSHDREFLSTYLHLPGSVLGLLLLFLLLQVKIVKVEWVELGAALLLAQLLLFSFLPL